MQYVLFEQLTIPLEFIWLCAALVFIGAEIAAPGLFYCLAFAFGCSTAALTAYLEFSIMLQCVASLVGAIVAFFLLHQFIQQNHLSKKQFEKTLTNADALIGQQALVIEPIELHKRGLVKIRGEVWPAETHENKIFIKNSLVFVVHLKGNCLLIKS